MALTCSKPMLSSPSLQINGLSRRMSSTRLVSSLSAHCNSQLKNIIRVSVAAAVPGPKVAAASRDRIIRRLQHLAPCSAVTGGDGSGVPVQTDQKLQLPFTETAPESASKNVNLTIEDVCPKPLLPWVRLSRVDNILFFTGGPFLALWPSLWGVALAAANGSGPDWRMLALFFASNAIFFCALCTINDLCDKDIDAQVERTKMRPLVTGAISPVQGWAFFGVQMLLYVALNVFQLENFSQVQGLGAIYILIHIVYPLMKRWTYYPQAWLGLAVNWSAFLGWAAVRGTGELVSMVLPLFTAGWCWTIAYDTIYAHQDIKDDIKAGVKSTAIAFGKNSKLWLTGLNTTFIAGLSYVGYNAGLGWPFFVSVAASAVHLAWQLLTMDLESPADCGAKFDSNKWIGAMVVGGIILGRLLA